MGLSGVQRTLKFVKYLPENQWTPIVLTTTAPAFYAFDESLENDIPESCIIYRTEKDPTNPLGKHKAKKMTYPSGFLQKARRMFLQTFLQPDSRRNWKKHALKTAETIIKEHDINVIYATAPPFTDFLVGYELAKKHNLPLIIDYRDLWVDNAYYYYTTPFHRLYASKMESKILDYASKIIVITRSMKQSLLNRYKSVAYSEVAIIPHGYDSEDFMLAKPLVRIDRTKFVITHSGLFPDDLTPKYFLKAAKKFIESNSVNSNEIELRFVGILKKSHLKMINKLGLAENVKHLDYVPHIEAVKNLMESDLLWMMVPNSIVTPSRVFEYIGSGKNMILCSPESNITKIAEDTGLATICPPKDIEAIEKALKLKYIEWKSSSLPKGKEEIIAKYDRKLLTTELARELSLYAIYF